MANLTAPPPLHRPSSPSLSSLPDEIIVNCLSRISISYYRDLCLVSKSFYSLLSSPELYAARSQIGNTELRLYVCLRIPTGTAINLRWFTLFDPDQTIIPNGGEIKGEISLVPVKLSSSYSSAQLNLNATNVAVGSEIYQIGGSNNGKLSRVVCVLDCRSHTWRRGPSMTVERSGAKSCYLDGKIYVMGGCKKEEEGMNWGEVLDIKTQIWKPLPNPSGEDDFSCWYKVLVLGGKVLFTHDRKIYAYEPREGRWVLEVGFPRLEMIIGERWYVIEDVVFIDGCGTYWWYSSKRETWFEVKGLEDLCTKRYFYPGTIQLANYGGKLVTVWCEKIIESVNPIVFSQNMRICCAVIRLEKRLTDFGTQIWGIVERCNVLVPSVPKSSELFSCLSVTL